MNRHWTPYAMMIVVLALALAVVTLPSGAQEGEAEECASLVEEAIAVVGDACLNLGRNQACYGNVEVSATGWEDSELDFTQSGDRVSVVDIASLVTRALSLEDDIWGVALMALQANLPGTMPGQNVKFVLFGDVELENEVDPGEVVIPPTLVATSTGNINIRIGPGTNYAVAGGLANGEEVTVNGRNEAGDWVQFAYEDMTAWAYAPLLTLDGDVETLLVTGGAEVPPFGAPMQAFRLTTGLGEPACEEVPRDGVLIQGPQETTVNFLVNGVEITLGSTVFVYLDANGNLVVIVLDGRVVVGSGGVEVELNTGEKVTVVPGQAPGQPEGYTYPEVRGLPVNLLDEPVNIVAPGRVYLFEADCFFMDHGVPYATAGDPIAIALDWVGEPETVAQFRQFQVTATYDGEPLEFWGHTGPAPFPLAADYFDDPHLATWWWTKTDLQPGKYVIELRGLDQIWPGHARERESCTIQVR